MTGQNDEFVEYVRLTMLQQAREDDAVIDTWLTGGMVGRLVRRGTAPLTVEACDPEHNGEWCIWVFPDGKPAS